MDSEAKPNRATSDTTKSGKVVSEPAVQKSAPSENKDKSNVTAQTSSPQSGSGDKSKTSDPAVESKTSRKKEALQQQTIEESQFLRCEQQISRHKLLTVSKLQTIAPKSNPRGKLPPANWTWFLQPRRALPPPKKARKKWLLKRPNPGRQNRLQQLQSM